MLRNEWQPPPDNTPSPDAPIELPPGEPDLPTQAPNEVPPGPDEIPKPAPAGAKSIRLYKVKHKMSGTSVPAFDRTIQKTIRWLSILEGTIGTDDRNQAYLALRAVLHALRDRIPPNESSQFAAQLPMLIRGFFYEGWHPADKPLKYRHKREFLEQIAKEAPALPEAALEPTVTAVFGLIDSEISHGEAEQVRALLPAELRELWPRPGL